MVKKAAEIVQEKVFHAKSGNTIDHVRRNHRRQPSSFNFHGSLQSQSPAHVQKKQGGRVMATLAVIVVVS